MRNVRRVVVSLCLMAVALAGVASAQTWNAEQQEIWKLEEQQWKMSAEEDLGWIESMTHPNLSYWDNGNPAPQTRASLGRWSPYTNENSTVLAQELFPIAITVTGNVAVVQYYYSTARENTQTKERKTTHGRYTDFLIKEDGRWKFIGWAGGDDPAN